MSINYITIKLKQNSSRKEQIMSKHYLCKCNKCETIMFDENPSSEKNRVVIEDVDAPIDNMMYCDDHWVCPNCTTDDYLIDYVPNNQSQQVDSTNFKNTVSHIEQISSDIKSLVECIDMYDESIDRVQKSKDMDISLGDIDLESLTPKTIDLIKELIINDLKTTQDDWLKEIRDMTKILHTEIDKL